MVSYCPHLLAAVDDWEQVKKRFGTYRVVANSMELESLDPNRIWTEGNPGAEFLVIH